MTPTFRHADSCDMANVSRFYEHVWQETYLSLMDVRELSSWRARRDWRALPADEGTVVVAEHDGQLVGFGACGPARDGELGTFGEIYAIHVARQFRSRGIGSGLMGRMAREFAERDVADVGLWVFHRNVTAVVFARSLGAVVTGSRDDEQGAGNTELALIWPKASDLALFDDAQHGPMQHSAGRSLGMMPLAPCMPSCK
ncbi:MULTISPECIES: GNAT family N-acetyltransferase [unclassified Chelatococcus]|uniref:GNAT family N-acetyltransferase n=1 Tax=unclassified Chelatococcus TaxID=2638111 RepID=UPI001BCD389D|nr:MULTISPECIES: GNAT family N-acetyltransferase [unclassified Chelatococcus]MBS7697537.1 GNAT family N-acetyltransferase [Chelatococcus sp. YT9]MBX3559388.1 GNAT family N-acetyltransferase [Chelatococcus sp.]